MLEPSASNKAANYFTGLQHMRKKLWDKYRHLLIPMIRTQIGQSGTQRMVKTSKNLGLRQTKRLDDLKTSNLHLALRSTKRSRNLDNLPSESINGLEDFRGYQSKPWKRYQFESLNRFGRSGPKPTTQKHVMRENLNADSSMMNYFAYSLLGMLILFYY